MHDALHGQSFPLVRLGRELGTAVQAVGVEVMALRATLILLILYGATSTRVMRGRTAFDVARAVQRA
jgi:hypothetical protein